MASPIGHSIAGLIGWIASDDFRRNGANRLLLWYLVAANAADIDLVLGILLGDSRLFHHGITHSIGAMAAFGLMLLAARWIRRQPLQFSILALTAVYGSHLLIDWLTADFVPPIGATFLWPFSADYFHFPFPVFLNIERRQVWQWPTLMHNLVAVLRECLMLLPLLGIVLYRKRHDG
ncbi:MAG: metal-dependent hydrolase [Thermodesulfobacteriota bacterium]